MPGFKNRNEQTVIRNTGKAGTDYLQYVYEMKCQVCGHHYGANGSDIHLRKCPSCQEDRDCRFEAMTLLFEPLGLRTLLDHPVARPSKSVHRHRVVLFGDCHQWVGLVIDSGRHAVSGTSAVGAATTGLRNFRVAILTFCPARAQTVRS